MIQEGLVLLAEGRQFGGLANVVLLYSSQLSLKVLKLSSGDGGVCDAHVPEASFAVVMLAKLLGEVEFEF